MDMKLNDKQVMAMSVGATKSMKKEGGMMMKRGKMAMKKWKVMMKKGKMMNKYK